MTHLNNPQLEPLLVSWAGESTGIHNGENYEEPTDAIPVVDCSTQNLTVEVNENMEEKIDDPWEMTRRFKSPLTYEQFEMNPRGVFRVVNKKVGTEWEEELTPLCGPLRVIGVARDLENLGWSTLVLAKDPEGIEHQLTIRKDQLDGETLTQMLRSAGVTVVANFKAKEMLVTFLQECPPEQEKRYRITDQTGWHEKSYILPDGKTLGSADQEYILLSSKSKDHKTFTPSGSHTEWIDHVGSLCNGNSRLLFAVSVAFAAPLLKLLGAEGGGFNLVGV